MRVLVTGGAGFIGSHIADSLINENHEVGIIDDLSGGFLENVPAKAQFFRCDIRSDEAAEHIRAFKPRAVFHLAAQMDVRRSVADIKWDADANVVGAVNIADAAVQSGAEVFIMASTGGAIYGEQDIFPADENHPARPLSPYGVSKLCGEHYLEYYRRIGAMRTVALRFANVYGPRQNPHGEAGVVAIFCKRLLNGEAPRINGEGKQTRDYVYVADVVRANLAALHNEEAAGAYNIGTGVETDVNELAEKLCAAFGEGDIKPTHGPAKPGEQLRSVIDAARAGRELDCRPEIDIDRGLGETLAWFRANAAGA